MPLDAIAAPFASFVDGLCVDLTEPDFSRLTVATLAHHLARVSRWSGGTRGAQSYSVAQHTLGCLDALHAMPAFQRLPHAEAAIVSRAVLLHDAHETVTGDVPSPVKRMIGPALAFLEQRLDDALARRFGLPVLPRHLRRLVKIADAVALASEAAALMAPAERSWTHELPEPRHNAAFAQPWPAAAAEREFLRACCAWGIA